MTEIPEPSVQPWKYLVSCLPEGHADWDLFTIQVERRNGGLWAVIQRSQLLGADGTWSWGFEWSGHIEGPATDAEQELHDKEQEAWTAAHHFDHDTALRLAKEAAPKLQYRGYTVADALAEPKPEEATR
jgi:hypothetical protein